MAAALARASGPAQVGPLGSSTSLGNCRRRTSCCDRCISWEYRSDRPKEGPGEQEVLPPPQVEAEPEPVVGPEAAVMPVAAAEPAVAALPEEPPEPEARALRAAQEPLRSAPGQAGSSRPYTSPAPRPSSAQSIHGGPKPSGCAGIHLRSD